MGSDVVVLGLLFNSSTASRSSDLDQGREDDLSFFDYSSTFCVLLIKLHYHFFPYLVKEYNFMFINIEER